jgi:DNA-binding MarR family transcriptional regulator
VVRGGPLSCGHGGDGLIWEHVQGTYTRSALGARLRARATGCRPGDCHQTVTARSNAASALTIRAPSRLRKPHRLTSRPLAFVPSGQPPASIERQRAHRLVAAAQAARELANHLHASEELEAFEHALALAAEAAGAAFRAQTGWLDGVRAGLVALLEFFDEEPVLARYLVVASAQAEPAVLARRGEVLAQVARLLDDERAPARAYPPPLTAHAVASGVLGVLHERLSQLEPGVLAELAGPLMSFTVLPFLGARAARRELHRPAETVSSPSAHAPIELLQDPGKRLSHRREIEVLAVIAGEPGLSNAQVGTRGGIEDQGHASRLLARLARLGVIENTPNPARPGANAWRLTASGERMHAAARDEARTPAGALADLSKELSGRLDFWALCVLMAVAEQPWLTSSELAERAGIEDPAQISRLLVLLAELQLVESVREPHRKGTPKVWQITDRGRDLEQTFGLEVPKRAPSRALDLMWQSGGRLSKPAIRVLRVSAAEPGLSNGEIARRAGIADPNSVSQLLAGLARRDLIENARNGGRENAWLLTAAGTTLERAIREEAPAPASRTVASDLLGEAGGRLNHRVVAVLGAIATEPGLSNQELAERVGIDSKGHASLLLARLARFGLIENQVLDPTPFTANAWRLTTSGRQLQAAIRQVLGVAPDVFRQRTSPTSPLAKTNTGGSRT